jgi:putative DNA methylase
MSEYRKKLIEVALPLEAINKESAREKSIRHGHPSTLHLWWARRPLAACRAVLFAQMVDDPSSLPDEFPTEEAQKSERQRLFRIIEEFVKWENITNEAVLHKARVEIARCAARNHGVSLPSTMTSVEVANALKLYAPPVLDPFSGGGSIPLEAQRLGLEAYASDLNPVAVLINKALIEIPPKFTECSPVNRESRQRYLHKEWKGAEGLAEDVRYYGQWIRDEAWKRIGHLYPKVQLPKEYGDSEATVIAWLWARTVKCPNPACGADMPLIRSLWLSKKRDKETLIQPHIDRTSSPPLIHFSVEPGKHNPGDGTASRRGATCIACGTAVPLNYVRAEGKAGRMTAQLIAIVAEGKGGRVYLSPLAKQEQIANSATPTWEPTAELSNNARHMSPPLYGMRNFADLFTARQLVALTTISDLILEVRSLVADALTEDVSYADAVATYLAFAADKAANYWSSLCAWHQSAEKMVSTFGLPIIGMVWDYAEANPFSDSSGNWLLGVEQAAKSLEAAPASGKAQVFQRDVMSLSDEYNHFVVSTDPPYYDNVPYADLSDFFYVWLRRSLGNIYPNLFSTLLVPKSQELVADTVRQGSRESAQQFFEQGLGKAFSRIREVQEPNTPLTIYYAFKQTESDESIAELGNSFTSSASTGWETMLEGLLRSELAIFGTWPIRTEQGGGLREAGRNSLASSIVLVCRPRTADATLSTRRDFLNTLKRELPRALRDLQHGNIAPVDLAQAAIGPGMAVFSRYSKVLESDGTPMRVRTALQLINQMLDEVLAEQEGEYDADTRWAVAWFEQYSMEEGPYGVAETLSKAKNTAVGALVEAGILRAQGGKVRLLGRGEFSSNWNPVTAKRLTAWEVTQRLIWALQEHGDTGAAAILDHVGAYGEVARDLAYRLYIICERKKWADEAMAYNSLVVEWSDISSEAEQLRRTTAEQARLFS